MLPTERRTLKMHPRLLWDVIHRQAGTLSKAILEGVMNVVDAGGTRCEITLDRQSFSIVDDGKGFKDMSEIENFFETFGYPHNENDATYGRFRMGRGQVFSFGSSEWRSNQFKMLVDLRPMKDEKGNDFALGYDFSDGNPQVDGCTIKVDLYDKLTPSEFDNTVREIGDYVKFVSIPVTLNGKVISVDPKTQEWDVETDQFYVKKRSSGSLDVYNQGVLVSKYSSYRFGASGLVVSKVPVDVNFARNDVTSTCPVFKKIKKFLNDDAVVESRRAPLNDSQRENFIHRLIARELTISEIGDARIITDVTGSHHPITVFRNLSRFSNRLSIAERSDRIGDIAQQRKLAFFVTTETADRFGAKTPGELISVLQEIFTQNNFSRINATGVERDTFLDEISSNHEPLKDSELNKAERIALKSIRAAYKTLVQAGYLHDRRNATNEFSRVTHYHQIGRKISVGVSDTAQAWTNGTTDIWINRDCLRWVRDGMDGMIRISGLLLHEQLHEGPSTGTHDHGVEFYERYHNITISSDLLGETARKMLKECLHLMRDESQKIIRNLAESEDIIARADDAGFHITASAPETEEEAAPTP